MANSFCSTQSGTWQGIFRCYFCTFSRSLYLKHLNLPNGTAFFKMVVRSSFYLPTYCIFLTWFGGAKWENLKLEKCPHLSGLGGIKRYLWQYPKGWWEQEWDPGNLLQSHVRWRSICPHVCLCLLHLFPQRQLHIHDREVWVNIGIHLCLPEKTQELNGS